MPIKSFSNQATEDIALRLRTKLARQLLPVELHQVAYRKIIFLDNACRIQDLTEWRSLKLKKLKHDRAGQWSIRINSKYRICFVWINNNAHNVEIIDYH